MGEHQRLKQLILGEELAELNAHAERVAALESEQADLPQRLPGLLQRAQRGDGRQRLAQALKTPVSDALAVAVRSQRQSIVELLFPVIGPAIRKAIAEAMRDFNENFNRALESSFTLRGLRWRQESWRTGLPYAQVVMRHALHYRLDHLFLIDRDSGLVLSRVSAPELPDLDADAIAGMLTAIGDFVRDSVGSGEDGGSLDSASVGEHLVWVLPGPRANLAAFIRGAPPPALRTLLRERLEQIHLTLDEAQAAPTPEHEAEIRDSLNLQQIESGVLAEETSAQGGLPVRRWPLLLFLLAVLAALSVWAWRERQWQQQLAAASHTLANWPGLHLDKVEDLGGRRVRVVGLVDAAAEAPLPAIRAQLPADTAVELDLRGYLSTEDAIVARRARAVLAPPADVNLTVHDGVLSLAGAADAAWTAQAPARAERVAGVTAVDVARLHAVEDAHAALLAEWRQLAETLPAQRVHFVRELEQRDAAELPALLRSVERLAALAPQLQRRLVLRCHGHNDEPGSDTTNRSLRERRARWLCEQLQPAGIGPERREIAGAADDDAAVDERAASLRLAPAPTEGE